jgi:hypothetical protein
MLKCVGCTCIRESAPCVDRGCADDRAKLHRMSMCTEIIVILRGLWGYALKADQSLFEPIMKFKADSPRRRWVGHIHWYNIVCQLSFEMMRMFYNMFSHTSCIRPVATTLLTPIRHATLILSWVENLSGSRMHHLFFLGLSYADGLITPFGLCYRVRCPQLRDRTGDKERCRDIWDFNTESLLNNHIHYA